MGAISAGIAYMNGAADVFFTSTIIGTAMGATASALGLETCFLAGTPVNAENGKAPISFMLYSKMEKARRYTICYQSQIMDIQILS